MCTPATDQAQRWFLLRPLPHFTGGVFPFNVNASGSSSIYHSFQLKPEKRLSAGLSLLLAYTNIKLIDDS